MLSNTEIIFQIGSVVRKISSVEQANELFQFYSISNLKWYVILELNNAI